MDVRERLRVSTAEHDDEVVIVLNGEVDPHTCHHLQGALAEAVAAEPSRIVVDMDGVDFVDSSGLRALLLAHEAQEARSGTLEVRSPSPITRRLLQVTALSAHFHC
jgi:anti-sigma B factor antagonist